MERAELIRTLRSIEAERSPGDDAKGPLLTLDAGRASDRERAAMEAAVATVAQGARGSVWIRRGRSGWAVYGLTARQRTLAHARLWSRFCAGRPPYARVDGASVAEAPLSSIPPFCGMIAN